MTQCEKIASHMDKYGYITPHEALRYYGVMRLASRMSDLKADGYRFKTETVTYKDKEGHTVRYAKYIKE